MTKVKRQRLGRILQKVGIILILGGLAAYIPYIIFPLALAIVIVGIFWKRFSQSRFWQWLVALRAIRWLFVLEKYSGDEDSYSTCKDDYKCPSRDYEVKNKSDSNGDKTNSNDIFHIHTTPPRGES